MSTPAKYIIADIDGFPTPIVFPDRLVHADVAAAFGALKRVSGAGFCTIDKDGYHCYGESISLEVKSGYDADSNHLNRMLGVYTE
jgi:hypothetical protein